MNSFKGFSRTRMSIATILVKKSYIWLNIWAKLKDEKNDRKFADE